MNNDFDAVCLVCHCGYYFKFAIYSPDPSRICSRTCGDLGGSGCGSNAEATESVTCLAEPSTPGGASGRNRTDTHL